MARVLVAEDELDLQRAIRAKLTAAGYDVTAVADGRVALMEAKAAPPDIYILDVMMPGMNGFELCEALRHDPATAAAPIIMLTARAQAADINRGLASGADDYMVKPCSLRDLVGRVGELLTDAKR
jgi:DNA-binding response OmpR family regulator